VHRIPTNNFLPVAFPYVDDFRINNIVPPGSFIKEIKEELHCRWNLSINFQDSCEQIINKRLDCALKKKPIRW